MKFLPADNPAKNISYQQRVKEANIKRIFDLVRSGKCASRAELVRTMRLSATSVSVLVEDLAALGLIDETGPQPTLLPGRKPISLRFRGDARQIVVFALSREGVRYDLLDLNCSVIETLFAPFDSTVFNGKESGDRYADLFVDILQNRARLYDAKRAVVIGLTFPGVYVEYEQMLLMRAVMKTCISLASLQRFQARTGLPLFFSNRPMSMAYAEKKRMDAEHPDAPETGYLLYTHIADYVRGALIIKGDVYTGPYNVPGEIGHFTIDYNGRPCHCGNTGCLERYVNRNAILADARQACQDAGEPAPESFEDLCANYLERPPVAAALENTANMLAAGLYTAICGSGIRTVAIGGIEALGEDFLRRVYRSMFSRSMMIHKLDLHYARTDADSVGLAQYFLDKAFTVTL